MWMRGGTSKGGYFLAADLPTNHTAHDAVLLSIMGSPDGRQIDGMGGADPLTSKVAVVAPSTRDGVDVDYLFLQVAVDQPLVSYSQNCGNILAGVGPFAIERGLVNAQEPETSVRIYMENTGQIATARVATPDGRVRYQGDARIDGVPGHAAGVAISFQDTAGLSCGALFPTGQAIDQIDGIDVTLIDNGMPCVLMRAVDLGIIGDEDPSTLEGNAPLRERIEKIRMAAGHLMHLGDVAGKTVPKMTILSPSRSGGAIATRTFIPHRCHKAIGVLGAISVATACLSRGTIAASMAQVRTGDETALSIEHPTGEMTISGHVENGDVVRTDVLRTARKLMDGVVFPRPSETSR